MFYNNLNKLLTEVNKDLKIKKQINLLFYFFSF